MVLSVTLYFIAGFALAQVVITNLVGLARIKNEVHFYDEGDLDLRRNVRAHGNFTETVPMSLMAMAAAEISGTPPILLVLGGAFLVVGRAMHYWIIRTRGWGNARAISMVLTLVAMAGFAIATLWNLLTGG
ncbi:MAPEG family protein [Roseibium sediminicola]|uniref:MAPEG family protein n=1 Tax=Roseibium sediminicola TaxID=2933272 RepID=A0ABT0GZT2_9HYPH|nr:MAPEG family protein [Roseibium sp. CAU 1639]MCK7614942.1 MAPEG family protein [Roseibium sp. CAU 1639]